MAASHVGYGININDTGGIQLILIIGLIDVHSVLEAVNLDCVSVLVTDVTGDVTFTRRRALCAVIHTGHIVLINAEKGF